MPKYSRLIFLSIVRIGISFWWKRSKWTQYATMPSAEMLTRLGDCKKLFNKHDIDVTMLIKCIKGFCEQQLAQPSETGLLKQDIATLMMRDLTRMLEQPGSDKIVSLLSDLIRKANNDL